VRNNSELQDKNTFQDILDMLKQASIVSYKLTRERNTFTN